MLSLNRGLANKPNGIVTAYCFDKGATLDAKRALEHVIIQKLDPHARTGGGGYCGGSGWGLRQEQPSATVAERAFRSPQRSRWLASA